MRRIHHVGIVVNRLAEAYAFYRDVLGLPLVREAEIADQGVRAALLAAGDSEIELLEPLGPTTPVGRFLAKRGEGLHHLCFETPDVGKSLTSLQERGVELLDTAPRAGLAGQIAFLHPRACSGVLVELATPPASRRAAPASPLAAQAARHRRGRRAHHGRHLPVAVRIRRSGDQRRAAHDAGRRPRRRCSWCPPTRWAAPRAWSRCPSWPRISPR